ncbi:protein Peter pan [Planococcus citri]|uniref:protein Peter pan n=1 Tax=Planococcus citri TaxID=170843 RepID=UPI0031F9FFC4
MGKAKRKHRNKKVSFKTKQKRHRKKPVKLKYEEPDEVKRAPHSFVIHRGTVGKYISELEKDFRKVMDPYTASQLQVQKRNTIKDFVAVSGPLKVSHLIIFTNSEIGPYLRIARLPHGPTLMFRIHNYSLGRDVLSTLKKQMTNKKLFTNAPLAILNNFTGEGSHVKLMASVFQNMFPTINVTKVKLSDIRRCVMFNYNPETKLIDFRHYAIKAVPVGISKSVKKIVTSKIPNLAKYEDISEFLTKPSMLSESEMEDDPVSHVEVPQKLPSRGNVVSQQSSIRLSELGPRLTLQLIKVEEGLLNGEVVFHELVHKTEKEKQVIRKKLAEKRRLKEQRKAAQEENVQKKQEMKELHKQKSLEGMKRKHLEETGELLENDDDIQYYRDEVGEDPDEGVFATPSGSGEKKEYGWRKRKTEADSQDTGKKFKKYQPREDSNNRGNKRYQGRDDGKNRPNKKFQGRDDGKNRPNRKFQGRDDGKNRPNKKFQSRNEGKSQSNNNFRRKNEAKFPTNKKFRGNNEGKNQFKSKKSNSKRQR